METREVAYLRQIDGKNQCELHFKLKINIPNKLNITEDINAVRNCFDNVDNLLKHIKNKIKFIVQEKLKWKTEESQAFDKQCNVALRKLTGKSLKGAIVLNDIIKQPHNELILQVLEQNFAIVTNAPLVRKMSLAPVIYVNTIIEPLKCTIMDSNVRLSKFYWFRSENKMNWLKVDEGIKYEVDETDVGSFLKLVCIPFSVNKVKGPKFEVVSENRVQEMPELPECPFEMRQKKYTPTFLNGSQFRLVTYNILSEKYTDDQFEYCPPNVLVADYRRELIIKEILGYKADIICLQEVDLRHYQNFYQKKLSEANYNHIFHKKGNVLTEGLLTAYNKNKFSEVIREQLVLTAEIRKTPYADLWKLVQSNNEVKHVFLRQRTSLQIIVLQQISDAKNVVIVANTHLYYHPDFSHIRLIQTSLILSILNNLKKRLRKSAETSIIYCGDFNSNPMSSIHEFILKGSLHPENNDCLKISKNGDAFLNHNFDFDSACGSPKYTNYTRDFKGCLDYIFFDIKKLKLIRSVPLFKDEELEQYEGLPNAVFPSDHVSLIADLQFL